MKKTYIIHFLFGLLSIGIIYFVTIKDNESKRKKYENYLLSEYEKVSEIKQETLKTIPKFDRPNLAKQQDFFACVDPELGRVPTERLAEAYEQTKQIRGQYSKNSKQLNWQNIPSDMGGRTRTLMWDPGNSVTKTNKVWAGSVNGGLWYNPMIWDSDSEWIPVNDFWDNLSISCMTYDVNDTNTFYVGTGESQTALITYRESSGRGMGIFKSENAGESWNIIESTKDFAYITELSKKTNNFKTLYTV